MAIKTGKELAAACEAVAKNYKTLYVMGCFGAPMTDANKTRYTQNHSYNKKAARTAMIKAATADTFGFDCVNLIKGLLWGWDGDTGHRYGGASYASNGVPDKSADGLFKLCTNVSTDFSTIQVGEAVWMSGHIGVYIGNGLAVECTPAWDNCVQITAVGNIGKVSGYNTRKWTKHGLLPYVEYTGTEDKPLRESAPSTAADAPRMWEFLTKSCGLSDVAAAGAIANWDAECALKSTNLENRGNNELKMTDEEYTEAVDNGTYTAFCTDRYGYGLCQWTHPERKTEMIAYIHGRGMSIGNSYGQMDFFWKEIRGYKKLMEILATTTSVQEASDAIMTMYEKPGNQSKEAKERRSDKALEYYNRFAEVKDMEENTQPVPGTPFEDVPEEAYYADAVKWAHEKGITVGRDATHFDPDSPITRAEMVTMLYRALGGVTNEQ